HGSLFFTDYVSLRVCVCLLELIALCHSQCFFRSLVTKDSVFPSGRLDKYGKKHYCDTEWEADCMEQNGKFDIPRECELPVDRKACTAKWVLKSDKEKEVRALLNH
uniref:Uncharacterized protein n=1 Tax=Mola mola TaxID=94237 RepID=A0A3Q3WSE9_MOLML